MKFKILPELQSLIYPLSEKEYAQLEANLKADGYLRDAIAVWKGRGIIIDGHHRYEICQKLGIELKWVDLEFDHIDAVKLWMIHNQLGRRSGTDVQRVELALLAEPLIRSEAARRMLAGTKVDPPPNLAGGSPFVGETRDRIADMAGVSHGTADKVKVLREDAVPALMSMARSGDVSVDAAVQVSKLTPSAQVKVTEKGPGAVKAKASKLRKGPTVKAKASKPEAAAESFPWDESNAAANDALTKLRSAVASLRRAYDYDPNGSSNGKLRSPFAARTSYQGTIDLVERVIRTVKDAMPFRPDPTRPGEFQTESQAKEWDAHEPERAKRLTVNAALKNALKKAG